MTADEIGVKVGKIVNRHKVGKHFELTIEDNLLRYERNEESIARETQIDGFYIVRTSESAEALSAEDTVRRATAAAIFASRASVAASNSSRVRLRSSANSGLKHTTSRSPG